MGDEFRWHHHPHRVRSRHEPEFDTLMIILIVIIVPILTILLWR